MDLSVVIPMYNSEKTIKECVLSILNSDFAGDFEVIVVDDGSTDKSVEKIEDLNIQIIRQENRGAAAAKNVGARKAKSDFLIFVDSDVTFLKDTLRRLYEHLKRENVDYVAGRYCKRPINQKRVHKYKALADYYYNFDSIFTSDEKKGYIRQVSISCGVDGYKKRTFEKLGGFDERIKGADVEREKLLLTLLKHYNVITDPRIVTKHNFPDFWKLTQNYFARTLHSMDLVFKENYRPPVLKKNALKSLLGGLTVFGLCFSVLSLFAFGYALFFVPTLVLFLVYFLLHFRLFILARNEYGFFFMLYTLVMNLFFSAVVSAAGFLGTLNSLIRK